MLLYSRWNSFLSLLWQITSLFCLAKGRISFYVGAYFSYTWNIYLANLVVPEDATHPDRCLLCQHSLISKHGEVFLIYFSAGLVHQPRWWVWKFIWAHLLWVACIVWSWSNGNCFSWASNGEMRTVKSSSTLVWSGRMQIIPCPRLSFQANCDPLVAYALPCTYLNVAEKIYFKGRDFIPESGFHLAAVVYTVIDQVRTWASVF